MNRYSSFLVVVTVLLLSAGQAFAQDDVETPPAQNAEAGSAGLQVGLVGSLGLTSVSFQNDDPDGVGHALGFAGGLRAIYNFTDMFGIQPELIFVQRGYASEMEMEDGMKMTHDVVFNYAQLPLLGRFNLALGEVVTAKLVAGPTFGYFVSGHKPSMEMDMETNEMQMTNSEFESDEVQSFDIGVAAGLGADFAAGPGSVSLDLRYDRGFTTIDTNDVDADDAVHTGFSFMLGYNYAL